MTDGARFVTTFLVTPARVLFLILLVGTTLEILAGQGRYRMRLNRWRKRLKGHTIVCGYGTKGKSAIETLDAQGIGAKDIVVIEEKPSARAEATAAGLTVVVGGADEKHVLEQAGIADARAVVIAVDRDDTAVLITLTARELAPRAQIAVATREHENVHLLEQSGANSVITSSHAAGRLLGIATQTPETVQVLEDLLSLGLGLDLVRHDIGPDEAGPLADLAEMGPVLGVIRDGKLLRFDDERASTLEVGDRVVAAHSHEHSWESGVHLRP